MTATPEQETRTQKGIHSWNLHPFSAGIAFCAASVTGRYSSPFGTRCG